MSAPTLTRDLDAAVAALKTRLNTAQRTRIRAEAERDSAAATADTARQQLAAEFGVTTVEAAQAMLAELDGQLAEQISRISTALDEAGL